MQQLNMQHELETSMALPQCNSQQIISQYVDDTSFTAKVEETSVDNLVGIMHKFGIAFGLDINWHKSVAYFCGRGRPPRWVGKYQWKWVANGDLSKLFAMPFGLNSNYKMLTNFRKIGSR